MSSEYDDLLGVKEDYFIVSVIDVGNFSVKVPCKLYLPRSIYEKPKIVLRPESEEFHIIVNCFIYSLKNHMANQESEVGLYISSPKVYFKGAADKRWGGVLSEKVIFGAPQDLYVLRKIKEHGESSNSEFHFWLNENEAISPFLFPSFDVDGSVEVKRFSESSYELVSGDIITIDRQFRYQKTKDGMLQTSNLIGKVKNNTSINDASHVNKNLLKIIDDFLLMVTFCSRHKTLCLGWDAYNEVYAGAYYRGDYAFPESESKGDFEEGLFYRDRFEKGLKEVYDNFCVLEDKESFRAGVLALSPGYHKTVESDFLSLYSGIESVILNYSRKNDDEFVIEGFSWKCLEKDLRRVVKKHESTKGEENANVRENLYQKLAGLNRTSLRDCFFKVCDDLHVPFDDLWPLYSRKGVVSNLPDLSTIRNKLTHGDTGFLIDFEMLIIARDNLRYLLERLMLRILGVSLSDSQVFYMGLHDNGKKLKKLNEIF
jgi:hypothetical protein